ncbi:MAG TPA: hypothetical protein VFR58_10210 [Flavisolibacter sp.]|nr:hypothetical protein [Flavisolibacter sp.]
MGDILHYTESKQAINFRIDYPYYGLFGSAEVTAVGDDNGPVYECRLLNGSVVSLRKIVQKWVDTRLNMETPLSIVIGNSIDDFLKKKA